MKKLLKLFVLMAVAVIATVACERIDNNQIPAKELNITVVAHPDVIQSETDTDTRTYINGSNTILWGTDEYMKIGVYDGTATTWGKSADDTKDVWNGDDEAYFTFSITPANASGSYTYYGLYPFSAAVTSSNTEPATYKVNLPTTQNATATSYDPKAYILVARPESGKTVANADWTAAFRRATALNKITLKNLSEDIKRVTITAPTGVYLAGARHIDLTTGNSGDIYSGGGRTETVDVKYATKLSGGADMDIWFTSWEASIPVDAHLVIVAYSDTHTYTRDITVVNNPITFLEGYLNTLSVNMSSAIQGDNTELAEGNYVVLAKDGTDYYALKAEKEAGKERLLSVEYTGALDSYLGDADLIWSLTKSGDSYIFENSSKYLGYKGSSNESYWLAADENWTTANYLLDITAQGSASDPYYVTLHSNASRYLSKNSSSAFFAFYGNIGQKADIVFVPATVDNRTAVTLSFAESSISKTTANYNGFTGQSATASPNESAITSAITYSMTGDAIGMINSSTGAVTLNGTTGTATVTASFAGDLTYRSAQCSYTITVTDAVVNYAALETSNVTLSTTGGANATEAKVNGNSALKAGTGNNAGAVKITVPANTTNLHLHAAAWNGETVVIGITGATATPNSLSLTANSGISNSTPFTLSDSNSQSTDPADYYFNIELSGIDSETELTFTATSGKRFVIWGVNAAEDTRADAGMSWSAASATATYNTGNNLSFTPLTLTPGNATGISYASTDETIATINASTGEITITALSDNTVKEGSTTIQAIYAGDATYRPHTATYTLTVVDSRDAATTPTFNPAAGEVEANQVVTFLPTDQGLTFHYTVNGTNPTVESPTAASVTIDAAKTVKVLATKTGYKPSAVAEAAYTIQGVQANDGSLEHPYTPEEARTLALGGDEGSYYISGIVAKIQNQFSAGFGTANFWLSVDGVAQDVFEGYKIKYLGNVNWVNGCKTIEVGDEVVIYGTLTIFNSTIAETSSGYLVSWNGTTKGLIPGSLSTSKDDANKQITVTWGAATGTTSAITYVVNCGTQSYNANAEGSHTFTMADYGTYAVSVVASAADAFSATATVSDVTLSDPSAGEPTVYTIQWGSSYNSNGVSSYTATWSATKAGFTVNMANFNNNNNGWDYVKCGRKNNTSVATIVTASAITEAIRTVTITIDAITTEKINSIKLYTSSNGSSWTEEGSFTKATGDKSVTISSPSANKYYKIEFDCASGSSNGLLTLSKAQFSTN